MSSNHQSARNVDTLPLKTLIQLNDISDDHRQRTKSSPFIPSTPHHSTLSTVVVVQSPIKETNQKQPSPPMPFESPLDDITPSTSTSTITANASRTPITQSEISIMSLRLLTNADHYPITELPIGFSKYISRYLFSTSSDPSESLLKARALLVALFEGSNRIIYHIYNWNQNYPTVPSKTCPSHGRQQYTVQCYEWITIDTKSDSMFCRCVDQMCLQCFTVHFIAGYSVGKQTIGGNDKNSGCGDDERGNSGDQSRCANKSCQLPVDMEHYFLHENVKPPRNADEITGLSTINNNVANNNNNNNGGGGGGGHSGGQHGHNSGQPSGIQHVDGHQQGKSRGRGRPPGRSNLHSSVTKNTNEQQQQQLANNNIVEKNNFLSTTTTESTVRENRDIDDNNDHLSQSEITSKNQTTKNKSTTSKRQRTNVDITTTTNQRKSKKHTVPVIPQQPSINELQSPSYLDGKEIEDSNVNNQVEGVCSLCKGTYGYHNASRCPERQLHSPPSPSTPTTMVSNGNQEDEKVREEQQNKKKGKNSSRRQTTNSTVKPIKEKKKTSKRKQLHQQEKQQPLNPNTSINYDEYNLVDEEDTWIISHQQDENYSLENIDSSLITTTTVPIVEESDII